MEGGVIAQAIYSRSLAEPRALENDDRYRITRRERLL
jgi:hypothetical protein